MAMHFFLGANSARGFVSLYPRLQEEGRRMYVLKGGPGCGKATCIRALCGRLGEAREFIHCCSDPDSLDGAVLEGCAIVDGTAPHVQEPLFPGSDGDYLTLPPFVDREGLARKADALYALKAASKAHYAGAYRLLAAAQKAREERESMGAALLTGPGPSRRAAGLLQREVPLTQGPGRERVRFMEGIGPKGFVCLTGTAERCPRVIALKDSFGLGGKLLEALRQGALERGQTVYACMDPLEPERLRHVLLPVRPKGLPHHPGGRHAAGRGAAAGAGQGAAAGQGGGGAFGRGGGAHRRRPRPPRPDGGAVPAPHRRGRHGSVVRRPAGPDEGVTGGTFSLDFSLSGG